MTTPTTSTTSPTKIRLVVYFDRGEYPNPLVVWPETDEHADAYCAAYLHEGAYGIERTDFTS